MARPTQILSHWHLLIDSFSTSSLDFYSAVTERISAREVPHTSASNIEWKEGGLLSSGRIYLRFKRNRLIFDLCAAPFGTSFFFSWWLVEEQIQPSAVIGFVVFGTLFVTLFFLVAKLGLVVSTVLCIALGAGILALVRIERERGQHNMEDFLLAIPIIGTLYLQVFRPSTYYATDTQLAFQESVHRAVTESVDAVRSVHGLRALSPDESKLSMRDLVR
ncbi:MAG TPA: hypothetical protein VGM77_12210 [Gemmatimonadales bacterium]|jgi:hypothetical protein